ncbi:MAG: insulinase family protein, partial [Desulfobacterales bacterium]|nr:insulinase family protein [Desulfobacterales bacterium]
TAYLGGWEGSAPEKNTLTPPPSPEKRTVSFDRQITQANIYLGHLGVKRIHPDYYTLSIMNYILGGGGFSSRLMASIRDEMG